MPNVSARGFRGNSIAQLERNFRNPSAIFRNAAQFGKSCSFLPVWAYISIGPVNFSEFEPIWKVNSRKKSGSSAFSVIRLWDRQDFRVSSVFWGFVVDFLKSRRKQIDRK
jgi:hypothetical protein